MDDDFKNLFNKLASKNCVKDWVFLCNRNIQAFAQKVQPVSPFKDKAVYNTAAYHGKFWTNKNVNSQLLFIYGISPNPMFLKGAKAPFKLYHNTKQYKFYYKSNFMTLSKAQTLSQSIGVKTKNPFGDNETGSYGFYTTQPRCGWERLIFGRAKNGQAYTAYTEESFADYLYKNFKSEIDEIIIDSGRFILSRI